MAKFAILVSTAFLVVLLVMLESASMAMASLADVNINHEIPGPDTIYVDCMKKSNGHHFVPQTLRYGQHFGWGFTPSAWGTTRYYCTFTWGARTQKVLVWVDSEFFPGPKSSRDRPCTHCLWRVTREGFYRVTTDFGKVPSVLVAGWG